MQGKDANKQTKVAAAESAQRMKAHLVKLDRAWKLQETGTHKIVYLSYSYIKEQEMAQLMFDCGCSGIAHDLAAYGRS